MYREIKLKHKQTGEILDKTKDGMKLIITSDGYIQFFKIGKGKYDGGVYPLFSSLEHANKLGWELLEEGK